MTGFRGARPRPRWSPATSRSDSRDRIVRLREDGRQHRLVGRGERVDELALEDPPPAGVRARLEHGAQAAAGIAQPQRGQRPGDRRRMVREVVDHRDAASSSPPPPGGGARRGSPRSACAAACHADARRRRATSSTPSALRALIGPGTWRVTSHTSRPCSRIREAGQPVVDQVRHAPGVALVEPEAAARAVAAPRDDVEHVREVAARHQRRAGTQQARAASGTPPSRASRSR